MLKIRAAIPEDLDICEKLFEEPELRLASGDSIKREMLEYYLDKDFFLVAEIDKKVIGALFAEPLRDREVMLWIVAVEKKFRHQGIGTKLLQTLEDNCRRKNKRSIVLYSPIKSSQSIQFYTKHAYNRGIECVEFNKIL